MKLLNLTVSITTAAISLLPSLHFQAIAAEPDYVCFLKTNSGKVVDLSSSMCGSKKSQLADDTQNQQAFIEEYKNRAMKYADVRDNLIANIQSSPEDKIEQAKSVCVDLKAGLSMDEIEEDQMAENIGRANRINASIVNDLAIRHFCNDVSLNN